MGKWKGVVGQSFTSEEFRRYVAGLNWGDWRPEFLVLHNTEDPNLAMRPDGLTRQHILDLEAYYRNDCKWSAGPHLFIDDHQIWVFSPLAAPGVHANSWNSRTIGVEMLGDYRSESFNSGRGLAVQRNAVAAVAILSKALDLDPDTLMLHKENGETEHDCPGANVHKAAFIRAVKDCLAGEPPAAQVDQAVPPQAPGDDTSQGEPIMTYRVKASNLNIRSGPGTEYEDLGDIAAGAIVTPVDITGWLPVMLDGNTIGWLALQYLQEVPPELGAVEIESPQPAGKGGMVTSRRGLEFIKSEEGCVLHVYQDQVGYPTIGVGHLIKPGESFTTITVDEALDLLGQDAKIAEDAINKSVRVPLSQNQFDALVSFTFNVGTGALAKSTLLKLLNQGQYDAVPEQLMQWVKAGGTTLQGLVNRRRREGELWES